MPTASWMTWVHHLSVSVSPFRKHAFHGYSFPATVKIVFQFLKHDEKTYFFKISHLVKCQYFFLGVLRILLQYLGSKVSILFFSHWTAPVSELITPSEKCITNFILLICLLMLYHRLLMLFNKCNAMASVLAVFEHKWEKKIFPFLRSHLSIISISHKYGTVPLYTDAKGRL